MTSWRVIRNQEDDVTAGHNFCTDRSQKFSSEGIEDRHEPVQINLGPNVGDVTTGHKPARRGRVNFMSSSSVSEAHEDRR